MSSQLHSSTLPAVMNPEIDGSIHKVTSSNNAQDMGVNLKRGFRFWMIIVALNVSLFLSALEYTAVSTALPTIVHDLDGEDFVWVASAYALASTALLPASGGLAQIFGRRASMLASLFLFAFGSALCGSAQSMNWLIAARTVQGAGGGGILSLSGIILSDMVTLRERAAYSGIYAFTWAIAAAIGPLVGGVLAQHRKWRWLFYLNLPVNGLAAILVILFLKLKAPAGTLRQKLDRMDWTGNFLIISSSTACVIALTWGGVRFPWSSAHVLAPLIIGLMGIGFFFFYEAKFAKEPLVPFELISNRTSLSGYIQTFINGIIMIAMIYYLPTYYQGCKESSPTRSGVQTLGLSAVIGPFLVVTSSTVTIFKIYRPQLVLGWVIYLLGTGLLSTVHADTPLVKSIGYQVFIGIGGGILFSATYFPVLAPLPVTENAHALAFFAFCRSFAGVWGATIGTAVLQTQLAKRLPAEFIAQFPDGVAIAYSAIPVISTLEQPLRDSVREAFASSVLVIWQVMIGIAAIGFLSALLMKSYPLHTYRDDEWALDDNGQQKTSRDSDELPS